MDVFGSEENRVVFLQLLREQEERFGVRYLAYCLMTNHVHLIAVPETARSLALGIGEAHRLCTRRVDFASGARGYLFQGRFFSCPLDEAYLLVAARYVLGNPVRAGMVGRAWEWSWSSVRFRIGLRDGDPLVDDPTLLGLVQDWREFLDRDPEGWRSCGGIFAPAGPVARGNFFGRLSR